jgi:uncharacterized membrane protein YphA (DoxX/SURF4 family)
LTGSADPSIETWIRGGLAGIAGILLLAGFFTPIGAALTGLNAAAQWISILPPLQGEFLQSRVLAALLTALSAAIILVGPGAFSIDARLFGLREIIIPRGPSSD